MKPYKQKIKFFLCLLFFSSEGSLARVQSISVKSGLFNYKQEGIVTQKGTGSSYLNLEWNYFSSLYSSTIVNYKRVLGTDNRALYQSFSTGVRFFPFNSAYSTEYLLDRETVSYDYNLSLYFDVSFAIGRYLISVFGDPPTI